MPHILQFFRQGKDSRAKNRKVFGENFGSGWHHGFLQPHADLVLLIAVLYRIAWCGGTDGDGARKHMEMAIRIFRRFA